MPIKRIRKDKAPRAKQRQERPEEDVEDDAEATDEEESYPLPAGLLKALDEAGISPDNPDDEEREMATQQVSLRLEKELLARVDSYAKRLAKERAGLDVSRADAVRVLLTRALDEADGKRGRK